MNEAILKFKAEQSSRVVVVNLTNVSGETGYAFIRCKDGEVFFGPVRWSETNEMRARRPGRPKATRCPDFPPNVSHLQAVTISLCRGDLTVMDRVEVTPMDWGRLTGAASGVFRNAVETGDLKEAMAAQKIVTLGALKIKAPQLELEAA